MREFFAAKKSFKQTAKMPQSSKKLPTGPHKIRKFIRSREKIKNLRFAMEPSINLITL